MATPCSKNARGGVGVCRIFSGNLSQIVISSPIYLFHRYFFIDFFNADKLLIKSLHIVTDFVIGNAGVYLCRFYIGVSQHLTNCFNRDTLCKRGRGGKSMPCCVEKKKLYEQLIREESITQSAVYQLISLYSST